MMKKLIISLILFLPFIVKAQNDSLVNVTLQRIYGEITDKSLYSLNSLIVGECSSDNSETGGDNTSDIPEYQEQMLFQSKSCNITLVNSLWNRAYDVVYLSNFILANVQQTSFSSSEKNNIIAQAKFLRSLMYFELTRNYGGVPLYIDTIGFSYIAGDYISYSFKTSWNKKRNTIAEVFNQIETDLSECIAALPERSALTANNKLKATKGAARALLAKVYLYQSSYAKNYSSDSRFSGLSQKWEQVLSNAEDVINSGEYKLVGIDGENYSTYWDNTYLYPDKTSGYRYIFSAAGNNSSESVFECNEFISGWNYVMNNAVTNWTSCRYVENFGSRESSGGWGFVKPTINLIDEFASESGKAKDDPRFVVAVGQVGDSIQITGGAWKAIMFNDILPQTTCRKYECSAAEYWDIRNGAWTDSPLGIRVIRYSDVILMAAEAALMVDNTTKALQYINMVRTRARMCGSTGYPMDLTSVTLNDIIHERRLEFALEGHRFYDLVRWNLAESKLNGRLNASFNENVVFTKGKDEFLPIPEEAVRASNGVVAQNPGYEEVCPYINGLSDMYITSSQTKSIVDVDFSSNTLDKPVTKIYFSSSKAKATLDGKKLQITYSNLQNGDSIMVDFCVYPAGTANDSIYTTFKISVIEVTKVFTLDEINTVKSGYSNYRLEMKNDLTSIIPVTTSSYKTSVYEENGTLARGLNASYNKVTALNRPVLSLNLSPYIVMPNYLAGKIQATFNALVILKKGSSAIAVQIPVDLLKMFPTITVENKTVTKDEVFTIPVSTTKIDTNSFSITTQTYLSKIDEFNMYMSYDASIMSFVKSDYQSTLFGSVKNDSISEQSGSLFVRCINNQPIIGDGDIVILQFKALKTSKTNLKINTFYFGSEYNPNVFIEDGSSSTEVLHSKEDAGISIYPNPVKNQLGVSASVQINNFSIFDLNGRNIISGDFKQNSSIDISRLRSGIYFIRLEGHDTSEIKKFIKQ